MTAEQFVGVDAHLSVVAEQGAPDRDPFVASVAVGKGLQLRGGWEGNWIPDRGKRDHTALEAEFSSAGGLGALESPHWHNSHLPQWKWQVGATEVLHPGALWEAGVLDP